MQSNGKLVKTAGNDHPLFRDVRPDHLEKALLSSEKRTYRKGEELSCGAPALYLLESGKARVYRMSSGKKVLYNTLTAGSAFGCAQLFGGGGTVTTVVAANPCVCLIIPEEAVGKLVETDHAFARNYVSFLTDRIRFLNKRISSFTAGTGEQVLASYLLSHLSVSGNAETDAGEVKLPLKMAALASALNMSRPTLYRAFRTLKEQGAAVKDPESNAVRIASVRQLKIIASKGET